MTARKPVSDRIDVQIFGSTYSLRGGSDPGAIRALADRLDAQMRELAGSAPGADPLKVAILAALRLADESSGTTDNARLREAEIADRVEALTVRLEAALRAGGETALPHDSAGGPTLDGARPVG
jgi:cell division protein ZapA